MDTDKEILAVLKRILEEIKYMRDKIDFIEKETEEICSREKRCRATISY